MKELIFFYLMLIITYIYFRSISNYCKFKKNKKSIKEHINDILDILIYGTVIYYICIKDNKEYVINKYYLLLTLITILAIGYIMEIPNIAEPISNYKKWKKNKLILILLFSIIVYNLCTDCFIANNTNIFKSYQIVLLLFITILQSYNLNKF